MKPALVPGPSLLPTALYGILTAVCLTVWHYCRSPLWVGGLAFLLVFWFTFLAASSWVAWFTDTLSQSLPSVARLYAEARLSEARAREIKAFTDADNDARRLYQDKHPAQEATPEQPTNAKYIMIKGAAVDREAMIQLADGAHGTKLTAEHDITHNQFAYRYLIDVLDSLGIVRSGRGSAGPEILDREQFDLIERQARGVA